MQIDVVPFLQNEVTDETIHVVTEINSLYRESGVMLNKLTEMWSGE